MRLPSQFRKHHQSKQQILGGEIFKIFGKGGKPYIGGLSILREGLDNPLEIMLEDLHFFFSEAEARAFLIC